MLKNNAVREAADPRGIPPCSAWQEISSDASRADPETLKAVRRIAKANQIRLDREK